MKRLRIFWKWIRRKPRNICDTCDSPYWSIAPAWRHDPSDCLNVMMDRASEAKEPDTSDYPGKFRSVL